MAEFGERAEAFRSAGADIVALAVDAPMRSEEVRRQYGLPFPILCDTERKVVRDWDLLNAEEKGGIANPAVFVIGPDLHVLFASIDGVASRIRAEDLLVFLSSMPNISAMPAASTAAPNPPPPRKRVIIPHLVDFLRTIWPAICLTFRPPKS